MRNKKRPFTLLITFCILFIGTGLVKRYLNEKNYIQSIKYINNNNYDLALTTLSGLENYKDANSLITQAKSGKLYNKALKYIKQKEYSKVISIINTLSTIDEFHSKIAELKYELAIQYFHDERYDEAELIFEELLDYGESEKYLEDIDLKKLDKSKKNTYTKAYKLLKNKQFKEALKRFNKILDYADSKKQAKKCEKAIRLNLSHTISAGIDYVLAITQDNKVLYDGKEAYEESGKVNSWENIVSIDGYDEVTIGLKDDGTVEVAGNLTTEQKNTIYTWKNIIDVAAGEKYVVALRSNGNVVTEGHNGDEQRDLSEWKGKKVIDIDAGWRTTVGLTEDGELLFAGIIPKTLKDDYKSTKNEWKDVIKISVSGGEPKHHLKPRGFLHIVGLKNDGTVIDIGEEPPNSNNNATTERYCDKTKNWENIVDIAAGDWYTVGLNEDGQVLITGENYLYGWDNTLYIDEKKIKKWEHIKNISAGYGITMVVKSNGKIDIMGFDKEVKNAVNWADIKRK